MSILEYGPPITLTRAKQVMAAAEAEAEAAARGWAMVISIVDSGGHLIALHRMDHAQYGSVAVSQAKAQTAINFKRPTRAFQDMIEAGGMGFRVLSIGNMCALDGGQPLMENGRIIGAIGVSGAQSHEDAVVAAAAARVLES